ncbi:hypothetical protein FJU31_18280 [Stenotrophomonas cyclobalanopsidis]|uniref:Uncharacterized protein n=1 Tax=Stenotrophomonas cyclobalanopsidis TaxID=2771362 RepID=A0ABQ6SW95_9GAMM|nr:hypothetical protein [Stenotrophomonas cyclobalanopsidis]KAA8993550.1 hypothetical protein FJU31_18280 [Stenotrophomonas cyclobalanopsidis]
MQRAHWLGIGAVVLLAGAALLAWQRSAPQARPPSVAFPTPVPALQADIERHLREDRAFRDDVVFLLAATVRDRCVPAEAGVLARMANRAALPVLGAVSAVTAQDRRLDRPIYQFIQHRADSTECGEPLQLPDSGTVPLRVDIEQYALSFPDSYYDPAHSSVPRDFGGRSLVERAGNACNSVVYSVLPLGPVDWRCSMLRTNARSRVRGACESELQRQHGSTGGELDMAVGQGMQGAVVAAITALPEGCR